MLVVIGTISVFLTIIMIVLGIIFRLAKKNSGDGSTGNGIPQDEEKSLWQTLGMVDNSPNLIRAIVAGNENTGPIVGYISNLEGKICDPITGKVRALESDEDPFKDEIFIEKFIRETFGKRVYGLPFIRNIKPLTIDRVVKRNTAKATTDLENHLEASFVKRYGLYGEILRPTFHKDVDTKDGVRFSINSYAVLEVTDAKPAFTIYVDSFLQTISEIISGFISTKVIQLEWEAYKAKGTSGMKFEKTEINELNILLDKLGVKVTQFTVSDPQLNTSIQSALEKKKIAEETANARRKEGEGEKDYKISIGKGEAKVIERIAKAKAKRFEELIELYTRNEIAKGEAVRMANDMIAKEFNADAIGELTTFVNGGTFPVGIPFTDKKENA